MPEPIIAGRGGTGLPLGPTPRIAIQGLAVNILSADRAETVEGFPQLRASSDEDFVRVHLRLAPIGDLPRVVDTDQFVLVESNGNRIMRPHVLMRAKTVGTQYEIVPESSIHATVFQVREAQYAIAAGQSSGYCLAEGARMKFTEPSQGEAFTLVFSISKRRQLQDLHLNVDPGAADVDRWLFEKTPPKPAPGK